MSLADLVTVIIVTSPTASDPSTETIATTIDSVRAFDALHDVPLLIGCDGERPEQRNLHDAYDEKLAEIADLWIGAEVYFLGAWGHQANVLRMLLTHVTTPLILFMEHDTPFTPDVQIDWEGCAETILHGELDSIRYLHEARILPEHEHLQLGECVSASGVPYVRTAQWSQRPHLARTDWYRGLIDRYFSVSSRCFIEDVMHSVVVNHWHARGAAGLDGLRLGIYGDPEPTMQRSYHLDGRAGGDKYEQVFAFPDMGWPEYAPCPSLQRTFE